VSDPNPATSDPAHGGVHLVLPIPKLSIHIARGVLFGVEFVTICNIVLDLVTLSPEV